MASACFTFLAISKCFLYLLWVTIITFIFVICFRWIFFLRGQYPNMCVDATWNNCHCHSSCISLSKATENWSPTDEFAWSWQNLVTLHENFVWLRPQNTTGNKESTPRWNIWLRSSWVRDAWHCDARARTLRCLRHSFLSGYRWDRRCGDSL